MTRAEVMREHVLAKRELRAFLDRYPDVEQRMKLNRVGSSMVGAPYVALGDAVQDASDAAYARERVLHQCGQSALEGLSWVALGVSLLVVAPLAYSRGKKAARA